MNKELSETEFIALDIPDAATFKEEQSGGLNFIQSNYEFNNTKSSDQSANGSSSFNFGDLEANDSSRSSYLRHRSKLGGYIDKYGFGWLLDQNESEIEIEDSAPLLQELDIDLVEIQYKIKCVLMPVGNQNLNRNILKDNPDFWGPLLIVLIFALLSVYGQFRVVSWIITIWIFGSFLIFVIARVLGGEVSYSQIVGTIGYSLIPLLLTALVCPFIKNLHLLSNFVKAMGVAWSTYSAATLLCVQELQHKKPLLLYPIFLLYIYFLSLYSGV